MNAGVPSFIPQNLQSSSPPQILHHQNLPFSKSSQNLQNSNNTKDSNNILPRLSDKFLRVDSNFPTTTTTRTMKKDGNTTSVNGFIGAAVEELPQNADIVPACISNVLLQMSGGNKFEWEPSDWQNDVRIKGSRNRKGAFSHKFYTGEDSDFDFLLLSQRCKTLKCIEEMLITLKDNNLIRSYLKVHALESNGFSITCFVQETTKTTSPNSIIAGIDNDGSSTVADTQKTRQFCKVYKMDVSIYIETDVFMAEWKSTCAIENALTVQCKITAKRFNVPVSRIYQVLYAVKIKRPIKEGGAEKTNFMLSVFLWLSSVEYYHTITPDSLDLQFESWGLLVINFIKDFVMPSVNEGRLHFLYLSTSGNNKGIHFVQRSAQFLLQQQNQMNMLTQMLDAPLVFAFNPHINTCLDDSTIESVLHKNLFKYYNSPFAQQQLLRHWEGVIIPKHPVFIKDFTTRYDHFLLGCEQIIQDQVIQKDVKNQEADEFATLNSKCQAQQTQLKDVLEQLASTNKELESTQKQLDTTTKDLATITKKLEASEEKVHELVEEVNKANVFTEKNTKLVASLQSQTMSLVSEKNVLRTQVKAIPALQAKLSELQIKLNISKTCREKQIGDLKKDLVSKDGAIAKLNDDLQAKKNSIQEMQESLSKLQTYFEASKDLDRVNRRLHSEALEREKKFATMQKKYDEVVKKYNVLLAQNEKAEDGQKNEEIVEAPSSTVTAQAEAHVLLAHNVLQQEQQTQEQQPQEQQPQQEAVATEGGTAKKKRNRRKKKKSTNAANDDTSTDISSSTTTKKINAVNGVNANDKPAVQTSSNAKGNQKSGSKQPKTIDTFDEEVINSTIENVLELMAPWKNKKARKAYETKLRKMLDDDDVHDPVKFLADHRTDVHALAEPYSQNDMWLEKRNSFLTKLLRADGGRVV